MHMKLLASLAFAGAVLSQATTDSSSQSLTDALSRSNELSTLRTLLEEYPQVARALGTARDITILAPSNSAFQGFFSTSTNQSIAADPGLVPAVLSYHFLAGSIPSREITTTPAFPRTLLTNSTYTNVTQGQVVKAENQNGGVVFTSGLSAKSRVTTADQAFSGGIIHIIDAVLTIPARASRELRAADLTQLEDSLNKANLATAVDDSRDITVFAPSNGGFRAISNLLPGLSSEQLSSILRYHVVAGSMGYSTTGSVQYSTTLRDGRIRTLQGESVTVTRRNGGSIFVNNAEVQMADLLLANGVAHVIDNVLNPDNSTATPSASAANGSPGFAGAQGDGPRQTAAIGVVALFAGAALLANL